LIAIKLDAGDELRWVKRSAGNNDVVISTAFGQAIRFGEKDARPMGRSARGVRGIRLRPGDSVVGMDIVDENQKLLVVAKNGYGKMTKVANFPPHRRGGVGIKAAVVTTKTGNIVSVQSINGTIAEMIAISDKGITIRVAIKHIPTLGRATQGVRIMKLGDGDGVASVGLIEDQPEEPDDDEKSVKKAKSPDKNVVKTTTKKSETK
jgi:DNA gyrase subunit A